MTEIKGKMFRSIINKSYQEYSKVDKSEYGSFLINDLDMFESRYIRVIIQMFNSSFLIFLTCAAIIYIRPLFLPIALTMILASLFLPGLFSKSIKARNEIYINENQNLYSLTNEYLEGHEIIKANNLVEIIENKYIRSVLSRAMASCRFLNLASISNNAMRSMGILLILVIYGAAGLLISTNTITIGSLIALTQLTNNLMAPIAEILAGINDMNSVRSIKEKIEQYFLHKNQQECTPLEIKQIQLRNIKYTPENADKPILDNVNLNFQHDRRYAIVGGNGCGKSTLLKVISGRLRNYDGDVYLGEYNQKNISDKSIDTKISCITQQSFLFTESIAENLSLFGTLPVDEAAIYCEMLDLPKSWLHLKKACINISGGEKQKITIIQSILSHKSILLWDEADSALDASTRKVLYNYIKKITDKLVIIVTHNLNENLNSFDEVITMDNGKIIKIENIQTPKEVDWHGQKSTSLSGMR